MMLVDSNIIIYSALPQHKKARQFLTSNPVSASAISHIEVLGFHKLNPPDQAYFETVFNDVTLLSVTQDVIEQATQLRQTKKMSLGDSIVAATCLVHNLSLATRNTADFTWIPNLTVHNPIDTP